MWLPREGPTADSNDGVALESVLAATTPKMTFVNHLPSGYPCKNVFKPEMSFTYPILVPNLIDSQL